jgi:protein-S-isoprenylcysteine O-methyltransferase Ste14
MWLAIRSVAWTIAIPGLVTIYIPWAFFGLSSAVIKARDPLQLSGLFFASVGAVFLLACIWEFLRYGRGTLSPIDPPASLVVRGLYKYVRNPMYLSVLGVLLGEGLIAPSLGLLEYTLGWFIWINTVVLFYEEPALSRTFGNSYRAYAAAVPRWLPRLPRS